MRPQDVSSRLAASRPFTPPIHALVLPSKIPLDLRLHFRDLDQERVVRGDSVFVLLGLILRWPQNGTPPPDHMNLLELSEALSDVGKPCLLPFYPGLVNFSTRSLRE